MKNLLWAVLLLLPALCRAEERPDWLSGVSAAYPKAAYIIGVGEGYSQEKAADKARTEIAKAFGVVLTAKSEVSAREGSDGTSSQSVSDEVRSSTAKFLDGVEVVSYWRDEEGAHHALAVLDRIHNLKVMSDKLAEIDKAQPEDAAAMEKAEGKFAKLRIALRLLKDGKNRRRINENYRVLNPEGKGIPAPDSSRETLSLARKAVTSVTVSIEASGENAKRVTSRMAASLGAYGLKTVEAATNPDVLIAVKGEGEMLRPENLMWYWAKGSLSVSMSYGSTGEVFKRFEESGQDAARNPGQAVETVLASLADRAGDHAFQVLTSPLALDD